MPIAGKPGAKCTDLKHAFQTVGTSGNTTCCTDVEQVVSYNINPHNVAYYLQMSYRTGDYATNGKSVMDGLKLGFEKYGDISVADLVEGMTPTELDTLFKFTTENPNPTEDRQQRMDRSLKIRSKECETKYNDKNALTCISAHHNDAVFGMGAYSTSVAKQMERIGETIEMPTVVAGYGNFALASNPIPYQFTVGPTYIDALTLWMSRLRPNVTIGYIGHSSAYGTQLIPNIEAYTGDSHVLMCSAHPCTNETEIELTAQAIIDRGIDAVYMMPWGAMTNAYLKVFKDHGILDKVTTVWWGTSHDITNEFAGVKAISLATSGLSPIPVTSGSSPTLFAQGVREAVIVTEAVRKALKENIGLMSYAKFKSWGPFDYMIHMPLLVSKKMFMDALSNLDLTEARLEELGLTGFMGPCRLTPTDHSSCGQVQYVRMDSARSWNLA
jgi:branched-chain amino acid transport system substrate-binding protein